MKEKLPEGGRSAAGRSEGSEKDPCGLPKVEAAAPTRQEKGQK